MLSTTPSVGFFLWQQEVWISIIYRYLDCWRSDLGEPWWLTRDRRTIGMMLLVKCKSRLSVHRVLKMRMRIPVHFFWRKREGKCCWRMIILRRQHFQKVFMTPLSTNTNLKRLQNLIAPILIQTPWLRRNQPTNPSHFILQLQKVLIYPSLLRKNPIFRCFPLQSSPQIQPKQKTFLPQKPQWRTEKRKKNPPPKYLSIPEQSQLPNCCIQ